MTLSHERINKYTHISSLLSCLSSTRLSKMLRDKAQELHSGIGGQSQLIKIEETPIFVKKVPLTKLEQLPENFMSTANIFKLPLFYQYGVGSTGYGAWRELAAHIMTTNWVLSEACLSFPILYHWRILPGNIEDIDISFWKDVDKYSQYWESNACIRKRIESLNTASSFVALFLEYIPQDLQGWLSAQIAKGGNEAESAVSFVEQHLRATNTWMNNQGFIHFDAHFKNILTDGNLLYLSDFGLALSTKFELSEMERKFLNQHQNYDFSCAAMNLLHTIITTIFGKDKWEVSLQEFLTGNRGGLSPSISNIIKRYGGIALTMDTFFQKLQKESKHTPYPSGNLQVLLDQLT